MLHTGLPNLEEPVGFRSQVPKNAQLVQLDRTSGFGPVG